jgi:hypothetical protein
MKSKRTPIRLNFSAIFFSRIREVNYFTWRSEDGFAKCPNCGTNNFGANALNYVNHFSGEYIQCHVCGAHDLVYSNKYLPIKIEVIYEEEAWKEWTSEDGKYHQCPHCKSYNVEFDWRWQHSERIKCLECNSVSPIVQHPMFF